jgi:hypothetical protein
MELVRLWCWLNLMFVISSFTSVRDPFIVFQFIIFLLNHYLTRYHLPDCQLS